RDLSFKVGSAERLDFPDDSFDVVVMLEVIEHIPENMEESVIKESFRVLKKNGSLIITTPYHHPISILFDPAYFLIGHRHYSEKYLSDLLERNGFNIKKIYKKG